MVPSDDFFSLSYQQHWLPLVEYCRKNAADGSTAEDIASDAFLNFLTAGNTSHTALYEVADQILHQQSEGALFARPAQYFSSNRGPEEMAVATQHEHLARNSFQRLPDLWRTVPVLWVCGLNFSDIAQHLDRRDAQSVTTLRNRALRYLRYGVFEQPKT